MPREERREPIPGYEADIHRALWERILTIGVPRLWAAVWICLCLAASLFCLMRFGLVWSFLPLLGYVVGHAILMALTVWDGQWDDVLLAQVTRRYKSFYEAE